MNDKGKSKFDGVDLTAPKNSGILGRVYESFKPTEECVGSFTYDERNKRNNGIQTLAKLAEKDLLVSHFLAKWRNGEIRTFEEMLVDLTVQLSVRSENLIKQLVNTLPSKSITIGDPQPHIREAKE